MGGNGAAASISVTGTTGFAPQVTFAGTHAVGTLLAEGATVVLAGTAALLFQSATVESTSYTGTVSLSGTAVPVSGNTPGLLQLAVGASLGTGTITPAGGGLDAPAGVLANAVVLSTSPFVQVATQFDLSAALPDVINGFGTLAGAITGTAALQLDGGDGPSNGVTSFVLDNAGNFLPGGLRFHAEQVTLAGHQTVGAVLAASGTLTLGAGVAVGQVTAATAGETTIDAADQSLTVFAGVGLLDLQNGSGRSTVIGAVAPGQTSPTQEIQTEFGVLSVSGGTGALTVFGGNSGGLRPGRERRRDAVRRRGRRPDRRGGRAGGREPPGLGLPPGDGPHRGARLCGGGRHRDGRGEHDPELFRPYAGDAARRRDAARGRVRLS